MPTQRAERMPTIMHNRVTIEDISGTSIGATAALPPDQRALLVGEAAGFPEWARLAKAVEIIRRAWSGDPAPYVCTELQVAEAAYSAWPRAIRRLFESARTVETGKPAYRIEPAGKEAA